jgi:stalled ribosome alternative rescue factor ArfA|tara:strand:- start:1032 stop:1166 length:135 start_codon:yes stop_codon:yes gene_type:complete
MKNKKKIKKNNPIAKLLKLPMLRNKIIKNKKKIYDRKKVKYEME